MHVVVVCRSGLDRVRALKTHSATAAEVTNSPVNNRGFPSTLLQTHCLHTFSVTTEIKAAMPAWVVVYKVLHSGPKPPSPLESNQDWFPKSKKDQFCNLHNLLWDRCAYLKLSKEEGCLLLNSGYLLNGEHGSFGAGDSICWSGYLHREQVCMLMRAAVGQDSSSSHISPPPLCPLVRWGC